MEEYDVIIIGGGPTGISASIYAHRFNMKTLVLAKELGGLITTTHLVENWPGFASVSGMELMEHLINHMKHFNIEHKLKAVKSVERTHDGFIVKTSDEEFKTKSVIIATGTKPRELDVPGSKEFKNKGISYCATCDAAFYKGQIVGVVGGSDSAAKEALLLTQYAEKVYIIYRKENIRPEPINKKRVEENPKIEIINNANVIEVHGDDNGMTEVKLDREFNGSDILKLGGLFIEIGHLPINDLAKDLNVELDEKGQIKVSPDGRTNIPGVYAAGDIANRGYKQAITGAAEGVTAAFSAFDDISNNKIKYE